MRQRPRWNATRARSPLGRPHARRSRSSAPVVEDLEDRIVLSTSLSSSIVAPSAAAEVAVNAPSHVALGNGIGVKEVVVETWYNTPYVFMINTNQELYYGSLSTKTAVTAPWNSYTAFSGWTFVTGAAKDITVEFGQNNNPYLYLINTNDDLYYGNLSIKSISTYPYYEVDFGGWTFLTHAAKDVTVSQWGANTYIYLINTNSDLYFGTLYSTPATNFPPVPSQVLFTGWTFITGGAKEVSVDLWRNYPYLFLTNTNDELYYGNLYFATGSKQPPDGVASFSGWNFITGAVKQVVVSQWKGTPYIYLINSNYDLYSGTLSPTSGNSPTIPPGPSMFNGWTFLTGGAKQLSVGSWNNFPYLYLINTNNDLYYGGYYTAQVQTGQWTYSSYTAFTGWTFLTGAATYITNSTWQNNPYLYLINTNDDLFQSHLYYATSNVAPWQPYIAFSGWGAF